VIGMNVARELASRYPLQRVVLIDKNPSLGEDASSRNSSVLHSGIY